MRSPFLPKNVFLILVFVGLGLFFAGGASAGCSNQTITPLNVNGNDYVSGGTISDTPGGGLDLCGVFNESRIAPNTEVRLTVELSGEAKFGATPTASVTGGYSVTLFNGGTQVDSFVTWRVMPSGSGEISANQTFTIDVSSIIVQGPENIEVTVYPQISDNFGKTDLSRITTGYIIFSDLDDRDGDGEGDVIDNCPDVTNSDQKDTDQDGKGDACDDDDDGDGLSDEEEREGGTDSLNWDTDGDGSGDSNDVFPLDSSEWLDNDGDDVGDNGDNCLGVPNAEQSDFDGDGDGNACDEDDDNDGVPDNEDGFPLDPTSSVAVTGMVFLQTTSASKNVSLTHIVNSSDAPQRFVGTLYGSSGESVGLEDVPLHLEEIAPRGRLILSSEDLERAFDIPPWRGPAMLNVKGKGSFELMTKLASPSGLVSNTNCVRKDEVHNIEGADSPNMSYIRLINIGTMTLSDIRGTIYSGSGEVVGSGNQTLVSSLAPKQQVWINRDDLFDIVDDNWNGEAMLKIESPPDTLRLLNLNFINSETFFNFSCYETGQ